MSETKTAAREVDARSAVLMAVGMACFGSAIPVSAIVAEGLPVWLSAALRLGVAAAVAVPVLHLTRGERDGVIEIMQKADVRDRLLLIGMAVVGTAAFSVLMVVGMQHATGASAAIVMATTPAVTAIGAFVWLGDRLGAPRLFAIGLSVAGVVLVNAGTSTAQGSGQDILLGSAFVFGAVCCEAAYSLMGKRLSADVSPIAITAVASVLAAVVMAPIAVVDLSSASLGEVTGGQWIALAWWGAGSMVLGSVLWFRGMRDVAGSVAAVFMGFMPLSALLLSYLLLGESPALIDLAGFVLVAAAIFVIARAERE